MAGPFQTADAWTDDFLEPLRHIGDPPADNAVATMFAEGDVDSINQLMKNLVANEGCLPDTLPQVVRDFLAHTEDLPPWADPAKIAIAEKVFWEWGPQLVLVLYCYSLPYCYAGRKGVQVLALTSRLSGNASRRILETAQMMIDVLQPGGLTSADGRGRRTLQKVRLMHAAVRHLASKSPLWNAEWDLPINQEDLIGTLMSFSWIAMDGLRQLGIQLTEEQQEAYLHTWQIVGEQLGMREDAIPGDRESAKVLTAAIGRRQFAKCPEGVEMTRALVQSMQYQLPGNMLDRIPPILISHLLGAETAAKLGIEEGAIAELATRPLSIFGSVLSDINRSAVFAAAAEKVSMVLINSALFVWRGGNRPGFTIPTELKEQWGVNWVN